LLRVKPQPILRDAHTSRRVECGDELSDKFVIKGGVTHYRFLSSDPAGFGRWFAAGCRVSSKKKKKRECLCGGSKNSVQTEQAEQCSPIATYPTDIKCFRWLEFVRLATEQSPNNHRTNPPPCVSALQRFVRHCSDLFVFAPDNQPIENKR
jgi:hypothetical protein